MATLNIQKVNELPAILAGSTLYFVKSDTTGFVEIYITNNDGSEVRRGMIVEDIASATVAKANKLSTARNITLSGDATGTALFDGSEDISINVTVTSAGSSGMDSFLLMGAGH